MISIVLAIHNEEKNLTACLSSVADFADEIIVVDGESTDQSLVIAKKFKAKIIKTSNKKNFHINKQLGLNKAKGDLVLQLDADEIVDQDLKKFILNLHQQILNLSPKQEAHFQPKAWWLKRKNFFMGKAFKKGGQYPDPVIRLFINGFARLPQKDVHEQMQVDGQVGWAEGHLLHYSNPHFSDYLRKFTTYTDFKATQLKQQKLKINLITAFKYLIFLPLYTFCQLFLRHKGFVDGWRGFIFALFSALHHPISYLKYWELKYD